MCLLSVASPPSAPATSTEPAPPSPSPAAAPAEPSASQPAPAKPSAAGSVGGAATVDAASPAASVDASTTLTADPPTTAPPTTDSSTDAPAGADPVEAPPATGPGSLIIGPGVTGRLALSDGTRIVATIDARSHEESLLRLAPGRYQLLDEAGQELAQLDVAAGQTTQYAPAGAVVAAAKADASARAPALQDSGVVDEPSLPPRSGGRRWRTIASPLMAATLPGLGHMVNHQGGKGAGILVGSLGMGLTAAALYAAGTQEGRALTGADTPSFAVDAVRLGAVGALTGALHLLYAGQIMDASAISRGHVVRPRREYKLAFELTRMATVGMNARDAQASLYTDWGLAMIGQPIDRLTVGVSDVSLKTNWDATRSTMQAGARVGYRFVEHERLWLGGAVGALVQASFREVAPSDYNPDGQWQSERALTAAPYLQCETRWFMLDRWSLHLMPRISMPFGTRYYSGARSIPNQALTFEIGSGVGVQF